MKTSPAPEKRVDATGLAGVGAGAIAVSKNVKRARRVLGRHLKRLTPPEQIVVLTQYSRYLEQALTMICDGMVAACNQVKTRKRQRGKDEKA